MMSYVCGALATAGFVSYLGSMHWLKVKQEIFFTGKKANFRILHISDFHSASPRKTNEGIWEQIHGLEFDMVAITGDLLQRNLSELAPVRPHLQRLAARAPVYFVDGNHEKFIYGLLFEELKKIGINVLNNRRVRAEINGCNIDIIGVADYYRLKKTGFKGISGLFADDGVFSVVLSHQPQIVQHIEGSPDILLCGHTHGGQVRLPLLPALFAPGQGLFPAYDHGWYRVRNIDIYISKGIGTTYFKVRLFNRPEVAVIHVLT